MLGLTKGAAQRSIQTFYEAVKDGFGHKHANHQEAL